MDKENLVKKVCKELGITQKQLGEMLDVPESTISRWGKGDMPRMAKLALELLIENKELKEKISILKAFKDFIKRL